MKRLLCSLFLFMSATGWASYQPITGSTVTVVPSAGTNFPVGQSTAWNVVSTNTILGTGTNNVGLVSGSSVTIFATAGTDFPVKINSIAAGMNALQVVDVNGSTRTVGYQGNLSSVPVNVQNTVTVTGSLSDNSAAATTNRVPTLQGIYQTDYQNGTAGTVGRDSAQDHGTDGLLWTASLPSFRPASYVASTNTIASAANASDITALCGNAGNTVLVYGLRVSCTQTTAGTVNLAVIKRSTRFVGAWSTMTAVGEDSTYGLVQSTAVWFTANPTVGTALAHIDNYKLWCGATAATSASDIYIAPADWRMKPIVLRGSGECVTVNLLNQTVTGGSFTTQWAWIETKQISP